MGHGSKIELISVNSSITILHQFHEGFHFDLLQLSMNNKMKAVQITDKNGKSCALFYQFHVQGRAGASCPPRAGAVGGPHGRAPAAITGAGGHHERHRPPRVNAGVVPTALGTISLLNPDLQL
jgi:hypothetical protein